MKVTVHDTDSTPTAAVLAKANEKAVVTDARGRKFTLQRPTLLDQFRALEVLGETAENRTYFKYLSPILYVQDIDGIPVNIGSKLGLDGLIQQINNDGYDAIVEGIKEHFAEDGGSEDAKVKTSGSPTPSETASG